MLAASVLPVEHNNFRNKSQHSIKLSLSLSLSLSLKTLKAVSHSRCIKSGDSRETFNATDWYVS